jgi:GDP-4-dehydro-6-deoxy-D-mannose reductase
MRILVTGITGFAGGHLAEALLAHGKDEVFGLSRSGSWPAVWGHLAGRVGLHAADLCTPADIERVLREARPEQIYHLAGYAHVGRSFQEPDSAWSGNLTATRCLYEAVMRWGGRPRILFVGSGMVYGESSAPSHRLDERSLLLPTSPYAASKAAADLVSYQHTCNPGLDIVRVRPFNHIGPRQQPQFAVAHFAKQVAAIERGQRPPVLETGNLSPQRDLTDVRDVVAAYLLLMEHGQSGEAYNVASEQTYSIQTVLDRLLALAGAKVEIRPRSDLMRASDPGTMHVDTSKLRQQTGWRPRCTLEHTLADTLAYWRSVDKE